jgi:elongation factor Tu
MGSLGMNGRIAIGGLALIAAVAAFGQERARPPAQTPPHRAPAAPANPAAAQRPFLMAIEDVFSISGRGTIVTGRIEAGTIRRGDEIEIVGIRATRRSRVAGVEMFRKLLSSARAGDNVGILLTGVTRDQVERGQVLARPGSIRPCAGFDASVTALRGGDGRSRPLTGSRRAQLYFRTTDIAGTIAAAGAATPGGRTPARIVLVAPIAMNPGLQFAVREGGRTIGSGTVLRCTGTR